MSLKFKKERKYRQIVFFSFLYYTHLQIVISKYRFLLRSGTFKI